MRVLQGGGAPGPNTPSGAVSCGNTTHHAPSPSLPHLRSSPRQAAWAQRSRPGSGSRGRGCDRSPVRQRGRSCTASGQRCARLLPHLRSSSLVHSRSYCFAQISQVCTLQAQICAMICHLVMKWRTNIFEILRCRCTQHVYDGLHLTELRPLETQDGHGDPATSLIRTRGLRIYLHKQDSTPTTHATA